MSKINKFLTNYITNPQGGLDKADNPLQRFAKDEDGAITFLTLMIFFMMLLMAGLGIDTMNHEMRRANLQQTLDNAVLAGAGAPLGSDEKAIRDIVMDFFEKAGQADALNAINTDGEDGGDIVTSLNSTRVTASASIDVDTYLLHLAGVDSMAAAAGSSAEIRIPKLEVSLVLDVSGSMQLNNRIVDLQEAATEFVTTLLENGDEGDTVISIIPFAWGVTPNDGIFTHLNINPASAHFYAPCIRLEDTDFESAALDLNATYNQQIYATRSGISSPISNDLSFNNQIDAGDILDDRTDTYNRSCYDDEYFRILPYSTDEAELHAKIASLKAAGSTSGDQGIKWGAALLDPSFSVIVEALKTDEIISNEITNVPAPYDPPESSEIPDTVKIIVMMGDGENNITDFFPLNSEYRGPESDLWHVSTPAEVFEAAFRTLNPSRRFTRPEDEDRCSRNNFTCEYSHTGEIGLPNYFLDLGSNGYYNLDTGTPITNSDFQEILDTVQAEIDVRLEANPDEEIDIFIDQLPWEETWARMSTRLYQDLTGNSAPHTEYTRVC